MKRDNAGMIGKGVSHSRATLQLHRRARRKKIALASIEGARKAPLPDFIPPQLVTLVDRVPEGDEWRHEIKFHGYPILCRIAKGEFSLLTRKRQDWTHRMQFLVQVAAKLPVETALLDGEVVAFDERGITNFQLLQNSPSANLTHPAYCVVDSLYLDGWDLTPVPLLARKEALAEVLKVQPAGSTLRYSDHWMEGQRLYDEACRSGLEGVVSKRRGQPNRPGRGRDWLKTKRFKSQEFVIGGFTDPRGARPGLGALLVGFYDDPGRLVYAGKVGTGFNRQSLEELRRRLDPLVTDAPPFVNPPRGAEAKGVHWVKPELVAVVAFWEWTEDNRLRHPSFRGLHEDKPAAEVTREEPWHNDSSSTPNGTVEIAAIKLTHPDRILYPEQGITKRELARYHEQIADWILPHAVNRPLTLVRCPEGHNQGCFYQRHVTDANSEWIRPVPVEEKGKSVTYAAIEGLQGLIVLVQMGVLELHTWGCTVDHLDQPDRLTFDLDPDPAISWARVVEAAHSLREFLSSLGLTSFVKTTGGKGLHVAVPIIPKADWDTAREFTKRIARAMASEAPDRFTASMAKAKRQGKIFIDYLRNAKTASAVCAYSTRARPDAPVSMPLRWNELDKGKDVRGSYFNVHNVPQRLKRLRKDPWHGYDAARRAITAALMKKI